MDAKTVVYASHINDKDLTLAQWEQAWDAWLQIQRRRQFWHRLWLGWAYDLYLRVVWEVK